MLALAVVDDPDNLAEAPPKYRILWTYSGSEWQLPTAEDELAILKAAQLAAQGDIQGDWMLLSEEDRQEVSRREPGRALGTCVQVKQTIDEAIGKNRGFCFRSHPFRSYRYERHGTAHDDVSKGKWKSYGEVGKAPPPSCSCAGSILAGHLRNLGLFLRPGAVGAPADQAAKNARVKCFSERIALNDDLANVDEFEVNFNQDPRSEQGADAQFAAFRVASSCSTCQVMIQGLWGNEILVDVPGTPYQPPLDGGEQPAAQRGPCGSFHDLIDSVGLQAKVPNLLLADANKVVGPAAPLRKTILKDFIEPNDPNGLAPEARRQIIQDGVNIAFAVARVPLDRRQQRQTLANLVTDSIDASLTSIVNGMIAEAEQLHNSRHEGYDMARANLLRQMSMFRERRHEHTLACQSGDTNCIIEPTCSARQPITLELITPEENGPEAPWCSGSVCSPSSAQRKFVQQTCSIITKMANKLDCDNVPFEEAMIDRDG